MEGDARYTSQRGFKFASKGDTSVVYLTPRKSSDRIKLELEVKKHESKVDSCRQKCMNAKYEKKKNTLSPQAANAALVNARKLLGQAIIKLDRNRTLCKNIENRLSVRAGAVAGGPSEASGSETKVQVDVSGCTKMIQDGGSAAAGRVVRQNLMNKIKDKKLRGKKKVSQNPE